MLYQPNGGALSPSWLRDSEGLDTMRHEIVSNVTLGGMTPVYINSTVIIYNVTTSDNGALYQCDISGFLVSNNATLSVVGKYILTYVCSIYVY